MGKTFLLRRERGREKGRRGGGGGTSEESPSPFSSGFPVFPREDGNLELLNASQGPWGRVKRVTR